MAIDGWDRAATIDDVLERMAAIDAALPHEDGVAYFNRMYWQVTQLVDKAVDAQSFVAGEFLGRLDVHFANLFFTAYAADLDGPRSVLRGRRCSRRAPAGTRSRSSSRWPG